MGSPLSLRFQTVSVVVVSLLLLHFASLILFILFSASTATLAREEQLIDRIVTISGFMEGVPSTYREYLAGELSGDNFIVLVSDLPAIADPGVNPKDALVELLDAAFVKQRQSQPFSEGGRTVRVERTESTLGLQNRLAVSVALNNGHWLNFSVSGAPWRGVFTLSAIPSLSLMAIGVILLAAWAVNRPLSTLLKLTEASEAMGDDVLSAEPVDESGPREIQDTARAFNRMQARVKKLLQTRNQMLAAVSHDFRTPLTRLRLRAEFLDDEQRMKAINDIEEMEQIISLTLAYAREQSVEEAREEIDLGALITNLIEAMDCGEACKFYSRGKCVIECQPTSIRRALQNVIENGLKYGERVRVATEVNDTGVRIIIDDYGPGVPADERDQVLLPFYRIESSRNRDNGGAGLGLAIAQTVIEAHGGTMSLSEAPTGGLRLCFYLPGVPDHDLTVRASDEV